MRFTFFKCGRIARPEYASLVSSFETRLRAFANCEFIISKSKDPAKSLQQLSSHLDSGHTFFIVLDERGTQLRSEKLAAKLEQWQGDPGISHIVLAIGPPYGFSPDLIDRASFRWALAAGTLPSDMAWLLCIEQVYRAFTINQGSSYHHD